MARIKIIPPEDATGELADAYDYARNSAYVRGMARHGRMVSALRYRSTFSLRPDLVRWICDTNDAILARGRLSPTLKDLISIVVSYENRCLH